MDDKEMKEFITFVGLDEAKNLEEAKAGFHQCTTGRIGTGFEGVGKLKRCGKQ